MIGWYSGVHSLVLQHHLLWMEPSAASRPADTPSTVTNITSCCFGDAQSKSSQSSQSAPVLLVPPSYTGRALIHQPELHPPFLMFSSSLGGDHCLPVPYFPPGPQQHPGPTHVFIYTTFLCSSTNTPKPGPAGPGTGSKPSTNCSADSCHQGLSGKRVKAANLWTQLVSTVLWRNHGQNHRGSCPPYSALNWD